MNLIDLSGQGQQAVSFFISEGQNKLIPGKTTFIDRGAQMITLDKQSNEVKLCDLNKQKVVLSFKGDNSNILDFAPETGKQSENIITNSFSSISN
jgi:hypothetical protein